MGTIRNKQRLLHLYQFLLENTDEEHQATTKDIVQFLQQEDANASRKTVKDDIEVLIEEGLDIVTTKSYYNSYFVGERVFEVSEVKLLMDMISASKSLTAERKERLIEKFLQTQSKYQAEAIRESAHFTNERVDSEQVYYNVYMIMDAMLRHKKIEFLYYDNSPSGERILKNNGEVYILSPYCTAYSDNRYYVMGYSDKRMQIVCFRIDRMLRASVLEEDAVEMDESFELDGYVDRMFSMYVGNEQEIILECDNDLMRVIKDTFGKDTDIWKSTTERFYVKTHVSVSPAFWGWVFQFGGRVRIISPVSVQNEYMEFMRASVRNAKK